ncbi:SH3 domain-containing protein [Fomes fomentarius]|nr:SH3 domain-containing protein [Fomes fomentarius]
MPVSTPSDPQSAALLAHVLSQTQQNISFLAAQNYITPTDAAELLTRLSQAPSPSPSVDNLTPAVNNLSVGPARTDSVRRNIPPPPPSRASNVQKARAIWAYNEDGREPNDLAFSPGETIEIIDETNTDWWTGKCRGRQGLFPSNHVEKIPSGASPFPPAASPMSMPPMPVAGPTSYYSPPQPYGVPEKAPAYHASYAPAPPAPVQAPAPPAQEAPKKNKFGKLGSTMANSAAGGVGFGAGTSYLRMNSAAIGSGIVHAIF